MPVRFNHRVRLGENTGIMFSTSSQGGLTKKERSGCAWLLWQSFYWLVIGWWWKPFKWFITHLPGWVNNFADVLERFTPLSGSRAKVAAWGATTLLIGSCCFLSYAQTQTPEAIAARAATQTARAIPTNTLTPSKTVEPTKAVSKTPKPTTAPKKTSKPTFSDWQAPTRWESPEPMTPTFTMPERIVPIVTIAPSGGCDCGRDYDCGDFSSHAAAQACYDQCGRNNWSRLDNDGDGSACDALP